MEYRPKSPGQFEINCVGLRWRIGTLERGVPSNAEHRPGYETDRTWQCLDVETQAQSIDQRD